jgi:hypothetical protein
VNLKSKAVYQPPFLSLENQQICEELFSMILDVCPMSELGATMIVGNSTVETLTIPPGPISYLFHRMEIATQCQISSQ